MMMALQKMLGKVFLQKNIQLFRMILFQMRLDFRCSQKFNFFRLAWLHS